MAPIWKLSSRVKAIENIRALVGLDVNVPGGLDLNIEESIGADGVDSLYLAPQPLNVAVNGPVDAIESIDVDGVDSPDPAPQLLNVAVNGPINVSVNAPGQKSTRKMKELSYALVAPLFKKTKKEAAKELRVSQSTLAVWCRRNNIPRWPYRLVSSMENMLSNIQECGMDGFLKEKGSSFTMSEIADKKRSFEANPSEPIEDSVLLLRTRMHRAVHYKRRKVVKKVVKDNS
ncbi:protein RKD4-like isoform X2 [Carex rostrata]